MKTIGMIPADILIGLIDKLQKKYGQPLSGENDWGQAVCREIYGKKWGSHPDFIKACEDENGMVPAESVVLARMWLAVSPPDWALPQEKKTPMIPKAGEGKR